ncbi:14635_t:CDS:1 [Entrophospora sp. SA101]|nr:14635_t:CDS:1 [Entrophospora sp. SA101]
MAPELFSKKKYAKSAEMFSFGVVMAEMSSGKRPYSDIPYENDLEICLEVLRDRRPTFGKGTPQRYIDLAMKCMRKDPEKRPTAEEVKESIFYWYNSVKEYHVGYKEMIKIKEEFDNYDKMIPTYEKNEGNDNGNMSYMSKTLTFVPIDSGGN